MNGKQCKRLRASAREVAIKQGYPKVAYNPHSPPGVVEGDKGPYWKKGVPLTLNLSERMVYRLMKSVYKGISI